MSCSMRCTSCEGGSVGRVRRVGHHQRWARTRQGAHGQNPPSRRAHLGHVGSVATDVEHAAALQHLPDLRAQAMGGGGWGEWGSSTWTRGRIEHERRGRRRQARWHAACPADGLAGASVGGRGPLPVCHTAAAARPHLCAVGRQVVLHVVLGGSVAAEGHVQLRQRAAGHKAFKLLHSRRCVCVCVCVWRGRGGEVGWAGGAEGAGHVPTTLQLPSSCPGRAGPWAGPRRAC